MFPFCGKEINLKIVYNVVSQLEDITIIKTVKAPLGVWGL